MMKSVNAEKEPNGSLPAPTPISEVPAEPEQSYTLTFSFSTPMREVHDAVIRTVLGYTRGNRIRAAELLKINPRTIRRHLGKKESAARVAQRAA